MEFAEKVLESNERQDKRKSRSTAVGMITAGIIALALIGAITTAIIKLGWWQSLLVALIILCCALLLRVLLTGEWSETSWFGRFISGGKPSKNNEEKE